MKCTATSRVLSRNPHVVVLALVGDERTTGSQVRIETVRGGLVVDITRLAVMHALSSLICCDRRCAGCLVDVADSEVHFKCSACALMSCVDCNNDEMKQGCVCGGGCLLSNFEHIEMGGREDCAREGWWRSLFRGKYLW